MSNNRKAATRWMDNMKKLKGHIRREEIEPNGEEEPMWTTTLESFLVT